MAINEWAQEIKNSFGDAVEILDMKWKNHLGIRVIEPNKVTDVAGKLKGLGFSQNLLITAIDWINDNKIEVVYHFNKMDSDAMAWIRTNIPRENPEIPSIWRIFRSAVIHEIETYDLMGVVFKGHPDLRRMFLPPDWNLPPPQRKDFDPKMARAYDWRSKVYNAYNPYQEVISKESDTIYYLSIGPQHPAMHGCWRVLLKCEGDTILEAWPEFGFVHRGIEKLAEYRTYEQISIFTDRFDYIASLAWNLTYAMAVEDLLGIEVPEVARWLRVALAEIQRIISHLTWLAAACADIGTFHSMFLYTIREREKMFDLLEMLCGARLTYTLTRIGGVGIFKHAETIPDGWFNKVLEVMKDFQKRMREYEEIVFSNETFYVRTRGIGIIKGKAAIEAGATGPVLRAAGIKYDVRKIAPYMVYDEIDFEIPTGTNGDVFDRWYVRFREMQESARIVEQVIEQMPKTGPLRVKVPPSKFKVSGEGFARTENPRGEAMIYIIGTGDDKPYRMRVRSPTLCNLFLTHYLLRGARIADLPAIIGSLDPSMGEVDR